nr:uncharacterized protein LOC133606876 [Nerophis lumbriciformis]
MLRAPSITGRHASATNVGEKKKKKLVLLFLNTKNNPTLIKMQSKAYIIEILFVTILRPSPRTVRPLPSRIMTLFGRHHIKKSTQDVKTAKTVRCPGKKKREKKRRRNEKKTEIAGRVAGQQPKQGSPHSPSPQPLHPALLRGSPDVPRPAPRTHMHENTPTDITHGTVECDLYSGATYTPKNTVSRNAVDGWKTKRHFYVRLKAVNGRTLQHLQ